MLDCLQIRRIHWLSDSPCSGGKRLDLFMSHLFSWPFMLFVFWGWAESYDLLWTGKLWGRRQKGCSKCMSWGMVRLEHICGEMQMPQSWMRQKPGRHRESRVMLTGGWYTFQLVFLLQNVPCSFLILYI